MGGFAGGGNAVEGISPNTSERQQRLNDSISRFGLQQGLDQQALRNYFLTGQFQQGQGMGSQGKKIFGSITGAPTGPAANIVQGGLQSEESLSGQRQGIANQLLGQTPDQLNLINAFGQSTIGQAGAGLQGQSALLAGLLGQQPGNLGLNEQLTGGLSDFFSSGGAPSDAQRQQIGDIFNAQREVGNSNLQAQFADAAQTLQEHATGRGLRFGDTPIQDRGNRLSEELARNLTNLETSLGGQEANALLQQPFQQATLGGQLQGQSQNQFLNALNAFSVPVNQGFNQGSQFLNQSQFGLGFSPANASGPALSNAAGLVSGGQFSTGQQGFNPIPVRQNQTFGQQFGGAFANSLGSSLGALPAQGIQAGAAGLGGAGLGGGFSSQTLATNPQIGQEISAWPK